MRNLAYSVSVPGLWKNGRVAGVNVCVEKYDRDREWWVLENLSGPERGGQDNRSAISS